MTDSICTQNEGRLSTVRVDWREEYQCDIEGTCPIHNVDGLCWLHREREPLPDRLIPVVHRVGGEWLREVVGNCTHDEHYRYRGALRCKGCGIRMGDAGPIVPEELRAGEM